MLDASDDAPAGAATRPRRLDCNWGWTCMNGFWHDPKGDKTSYTCTSSACKDGGSTSGQSSKGGSDTKDSWESKGDTAKESNSGKGGAPCSTYEITSLSEEANFGGATRTCITHNSDPTGRCFWTYVPQAVTDAVDGRKVPIVLDMHGGGGCASHQAASSGWRQLADSEAAKANGGMVIVWPQGRVPEAGGGGRWASCGSVKTNHEKTQKAASQAVKGNGGCPDWDDVSFLEQVIVNLSSTLSNLLDLERVIVSGFSEGCMMSHRFALERSNVTSVLACHAGQLSVVETDNTTNGVRDAIKAAYNLQPMPVFHICGNLDSWFDLGKQDLETWAYWNECSQMDSIAGQGVMEHIHSSCADYSPALETRLWEVVNGHHVPDSSLAEKMWTFANQYRRTEARIIVQNLENASEVYIPMTGKQSIPVISTANGAIALLQKVYFVGAGLNLGMVAVRSMTL